MAYQHPRNKLHRSNEGAIIGGVCSGLSETFKLDVTIIRVIFVVSLALGGAGLWVYLVLLVLLPSEGTYHQNREKQDKDVFEVETKEIK